MAKLSIYKYVRTDKGWRYCKAAFHPNGKIKPNIVVVGGIEEKHIEGRYFLNFNNQWIDVGEDALDAQRKRVLIGRRLAPLSEHRSKLSSHRRVDRNCLVSYSPRSTFVVDSDLIFQFPCT